MAERKELEAKIRDEKDQREKLKLQLQLAHVLRYTDTELSLKIAKTAMQDAKNLSDTDLELKALISICSTNSLNESSEKNEFWINHLEERGEELKRDFALGRAKMFRYVISNRHGRIKEAEGYLRQALGHFEAENNEQGRSACYISLGNLKFNQGDHNEAYKYYQTALKYVPEDNIEILFTLKQNIAAVHTMKQEFLKAWEVYHDILYSLPEHELGVRSIVLINLGSLCTQTGEIREALEYFDEVIALTAKTPNEKVYIKANYLKAGVLLDQNRPDEAYEILNHLENNARQLHNPFILESIYLYLIEYYKIKNDQKKLLEYEEALKKVREEERKSST